VTVFYPALYEDFIMKKEDQRIKNIYENAMRT